LLRDILQDHYELFVAEDEADGLQLARRHAGQFDLLLSNVVMPNMNGVELARTVQSEQPHVKVLLISAYDQGMLLLEQGAGWSFLAKPFLTKALLDAIEEALRGR
jgi:two-component system, cell cycle sensor histidine kinase and response regulator CckA